MRLEAFIASRIFSLSPDKVSTLVMRITLVSVTLAVAVMLVSMAVVIGFKQQIRDKVLGFVAPLQITTLDRNESLQQTPFVIDDQLLKQIHALDGVVHTQAVAEKAGIIKTDDQIQGIVLKGVDNNYNWDYFKAALKQGVLPDIQHSITSNDVLLSANLARKLSLEVGDDLRVWFVDDKERPRGRKFSVSGIYETGLVEFDERFVLADLRHIIKLNGWEDNQAGVLEVLLDSKTDPEEVYDQIYFSLPVHLTATTAMASYPHIFDWLNLQDMNVVIIILLMTLVSGITIISMLLIMVIERTAMIGMLKAMGAGAGQIRRLFLVYSARLLTYGLIAGNLLGLGFIYFQGKTGFLTLPVESYYIDKVPVELGWWHILIINLGSAVVWFFMLLIPSLVIDRIKPARAIRFS
ncbi:MAG: ABC transporter permease [Bacteroidales bacterium]|jgi:lipoprotein-releasing system permease protein|nr:ABC transporter permease [Bacteroidales bacterium]